MVSLATKSSLNFLEKRKINGKRHISYLKTNQELFLASTIYKTLVSWNIKFYMQDLVFAKK